MTLLVFSIAGAWPNQVNDVLRISAHERCVRASHFFETGAAFWTTSAACGHVFELDQHQDISANRCGILAVDFVQMVVAGFSMIAITADPS